MSAADSRETEGSASGSGSAVRFPLTLLGTTAATAEETPVKPNEEAARTPPPTRSFGPYLVLGEIERGGMGAVYRVRDTRLGRDVALKVIRSGALATVEEVERFTREAQAVAQLTHPHVVRLYDVGAHEGQHYFTMELAAGSLAHARSEYQRDSRQAVQLLAKVARALAQVHEAGLLHRDLKPGNILLRADGEPLISDFGLAKSSKVDSDLTASGAVVGTPAYMAPEQAAGQVDRLGPATDLWSLGVIAYELLCGVRPFPYQERARLLTAIQSDAPPSPRSQSRRLDRDLETIVMKCLEKQPGHRYASAAALADDLEAWLAGQPIQARPPGRVRRLVRWTRRHALAVALTAVLTVCGVVLAIARPWADPDAALHRAEATLAAGQAVTWLDKQPVLPWSEVLTPATTWDRMDGNFRLSAKHWGLLLLLRDPQVADYTLEADIRLDTYPDGQAGVFVCRTRDEASTGSVDAMVLMPLRAGFGPDANKLVAQLQLAFSLPASAQSPWHARQASPVRVCERPGLEWQHLVVRVQAEQLSLTVNGALRFDLTRPERLAAADRMLLGRQDIGDKAFPAFPVRGGLGLFVERGTASFRRLTVTPEAQVRP